MNTSDSRVTLSWDVGATTALSAVRRDRVLERLAGRLADGVLSVTSETERSQLLNRREARERLAALVNEALVPPKTRRPTKPSRGAQQRRLDAKKQRGQTKKLRQERF